MAGRLNIRVALNVVFLQILWFATILGAVHQWMLPALAWFLVFFVGHMTVVRARKQDLVMVTIAVAAGFILDSVWVQSEWLAFALSQPYFNFAPWWIVLLWAGLGLTLNHSLSWLHNRLLLGAACAAVSAPLSYFAAAKLGAVVVKEPWLLYPALSLTWALVVSALLAIARGLDRPRTIGEVL